MWLSKQDNKGNDVNLHLENIYLDELQDDGLLLYERIKVRFLPACFRALSTFLTNDAGRVPSSVRTVLELLTDVMELLLLTQVLLHVGNTHHLVFTTVCSVTWISVGISLDLHMDTSVSYSDSRCNAYPV